MTGCADGDRGMATVWAAGAIAVLVSMAVFGLHLGEAMVVRHQVESAADLAALAGAATVVAGEQYACSQARRVTDRMRVQLASCEIRDWTVLIQATAQPAGWLATLGAATARARAGPAGRQTSSSRGGRDRVPGARQAGQDGVEYYEGAGLVQWVVAVAAFGRLHAGRAARRALAGGDGISRRGQPGCQRSVPPIGEPGTAGVPVMDEHSRFTGVGVPRCGDATDVPPIAGGDQR